ncbi:MAG: hypothetical protein ABW252_05795 [Polyangiales bacterium]
MSIRVTVRPWLRVAVYLASFVAVVGLWGVHVVYTEARDGALLLAQVATRSLEVPTAKLVDELGPEALAGAHALVLNGQPLRVSAHHTARNVKSVLDRFSDHCVGGKAGEPDVMRAALAGDRPALRALLDDPMRFGVLRSERDDEGMLACFQSDESDRSLAGVFARLQRFLQTGDLGALGGLRFVTARRSETGSTHVVAVWTEGSFRLGALFPERGDAPGSDLDGVPRPPEALRTLTATTPSRGFSLRSYDSTRARPALTAFYDEALGRDGWEPMPLPDDLGAADRHDVRVFTRAGRAVTVMVEEQSADARAVTLIDLGDVRGIEASAAAL